MKRLALLLLALFSLCAAASTPEDRLSAVFQAIEANQLDVALKRVDSLIADYPNFRLAYLVRGDLLLARARPLETFGNVLKTDTGTAPNVRPALIRPRPARNEGA